MKRELMAVGVTAVVLLAVAWLIAFQPLQAAPTAGPTPVSVARPGGGQLRVYEIWNTVPFTADTTAKCVLTNNAAIVDLQYVIDQGTTNTTTLTTQWSNNASLITDGADVVTDNTTDAGDMVQVQAFGRYLCPKIDVSNSNPVTVTLYAVAK